MDRKEHWEKVYTNKPLTQVSWYQPLPSTSLDLIEELGITKTDAILDVGGGDSFLADHLLERGFTDITVLDISAAAIGRAKSRLGEKAAQVRWINADITEFSPDRVYDCWHDRAAFHFLTEEGDIRKYMSTASQSLTAKGKIILGTFSESGPGKCSGLPVRQYSETSLVKLIRNWFEKIRCIHTSHRTPFNSFQDFLFCSFKKNQTV